MESMGYGVVAFVVGFPVVGFFRRAYSLHNTFYDGIVKLSMFRNRRLLLTNEMINQAV